MPANSPGFIWVMFAFFKLVGAMKEKDVPHYICHTCGLDFNFITSREFPVPFCIFCRSENVEQIGTERF